jgi:hypothetical protein
VSLYCDFYLERLEQGAWQSAPDPHSFLSLNLKEAPYRALASLFFWPDALLAFQEGWPPDPPPSALCSALRRLEGTLAWLPGEALFLDDWTTETLLVTHRVAAPWAAVFGEGLAPFPEAALRQRGMSPEDIRTLRYGTAAGRRVSRLWGQGRHELRQTATDDRVPVTWMDSIAEFVGPETHLAFQALPHRGPGSRVLACTA